jgi:hypothetical protein
VKRSEATALVEAALRSGRIVQADHDMRLEQIKGAHTDQEVALVVRDLQTPAQMAATAAAMTTATVSTTTTPTTPAAPQPGQSGQPWPLVNYGPQQGQAAAAAGLAAAKSGGKWVGGIIGLVVLVSVIVPIVGVVIGVVSARDTFDDFDFGEPVNETTYLPGQTPDENGVNVHTVSGIEEMLAGLREETGGTIAFDAVLYPRYAVVSVPEAATGKRYRNYYWDGRTMALQDFKSTTDDPRLDLTQFDPGVMLTLLEDVRGRIDDPNSWYLILGSDATTGQPQISAYSSNEYGEGAYILAAADGTITYESVYE